MTYEVGLGDSPQIIAGYLSGDPGRYTELLAANAHKPIVYVKGRPTFATLGVGEQLNVPGGFVGDALCEAFGVGSSEEAFDRLEQTFGAGATPEDAFDALENTFGTGECYDDFYHGLLGSVHGGTLADHFGLGLFGVSIPIVDDIGKAAEKAVKGVGKAAGKAVKAVGNVAKNAAKETKKAVTSAATFVAKAGGDAGKFLAKQAKNFAKDPMGSLAKVASTGGLSLFGVDPQKALAEVGIPTPDTMLKSLGLPTTEQITHTAFTSVTNPKQLLDKVPGLNELTKYIPDMPDPTKMAGKLVEAAMNGDLEGIKNNALAIGHLVSDVASMVPGVGNVIGAPLASAITLLETGSALKAALTMLLNQVPGIPPMIRDILRVALNSIADIVEKSKSVTDVLLSEFKKGVQEQARKNGVSGPLADIVESVLDGAIQLIFKNKPLDKAALDLAKKGLDVAKKNVAKGIGSSAEVKKASDALSDLEQVYKKVNSEHALTQAIVKLAKTDPGKKNPKIQKQIKDLQASIEAEKLVGQAHSKKVGKALKRRPPTLRKKPTAMEKLAKLSPKQQEELRQLAALQKLSPKEQEELRQLAALKKLSPEQQEQARQLAALKKLSPQEQEELRQYAEAKKAEAAAPPAPAPASAVTYGPYPQEGAVGRRGGGRGGPPRGGGRGGGPRGGGPRGGGPRGGGPRGGRGPGPFHPHGRGRGLFHRAPPFSQAFYAGWQPWWGIPWQPEVVETQMCRTWGPRIQMPEWMRSAALVALGASGGNPTAAKGPDGVLYLFSYEGGVVTARGCADIVRA